MIQNKAHKIASNITICILIIIIAPSVIKSCNKEHQRTALKNEEIYAQNPNRNQVRNQLKNIYSPNREKKVCNEINNHISYEKNSNFKISPQMIWDKINKICPDCKNKKEIFNIVKNKINENILIQKEGLVSNIKNGAEKIKKYIN